MPAVARYQIHPVHRPGSSRATEWWSPSVWSDAGGRVPRRLVRVRYRYPHLDSPGRAGRDGVVLLVFTLFGSPILVTLGALSLKGDDRTLNDWAAATLAFGFAAWWWYVSVASFVRAGRGRGRRSVAGVVVARTIRTFHHWETREPYDIYFLGVDDGTVDESYGWQIPRDVYIALPDGTPVEAIVSRDGRYLYTLFTLTV
jgi:hypothetical protein